MGWFRTSLGQFPHTPQFKQQGVGVFPHPKAIVDWVGGKELVQKITIPEGEAGTEATIQIMTKLALEGAQNPDMVLFAQSIANGTASKNYREELEKIFAYVKRTVRYRRDALGLEWVQSPFYTEFVRGEGDCFVRGTKVLRREGFELVPIESLRVGDEIWGYNKWSTVQAFWDRGVRQTYLVRLNNGSTMRLTPEHKVVAARCQHYKFGTFSEKHCACPVSERRLDTIPLSELRVHDVVLMPEKIDFGTQEMDPRRAFVEGLYVSDGDSKGHCFRIAGRDGFPREEQKREVEEICKSFGLETKWFFNYISVSDADWTSRMKAMGCLPWFKRALSLNLEEKTAKEFLRGVLADSGRNTHGAGRTFTTSSKELLLQTRVLLKMVETSCSERFIQDHGSTSSYPIWRLGIRSSAGLESLGVIRDKAWRKDPPVKRKSTKREKLLRVKEIIKDNAEAACVDIATDDHYVWLPEADWTVHNCDDQSVLLATLSLCLGNGAAFKSIKGDPSRPQEFSHVYALLGYTDRTSPDGVTWLPADATQGVSTPLGWEPPPEKTFGSKTWVIARP